MSFVSGPCAQVARKKKAKGRITGLGLHDYIMSPHGVLTSAETMGVMWTEKLAQIPKPTRSTFESFDFTYSPMIAMTSLQTAKEDFVVKARAGLIPAEYVGNHGVGGLLWPPLEDYDDHVSTRCSMSCPSHESPLARSLHGESFNLTPALALLAARLVR